MLLVPCLLKQLATFHLSASSSLFIFIFPVCIYSLSYLTISINTYVNSEYEYKSFPIICLSAHLSAALVIFFIFIFSYFYLCLLCPKYSRWKNSTYQAEKKYPLIRFIFISLSFPFITNVLSYSVKERKLEVSIANGFQRVFFMHFLLLLLSY